MEKLPLRVCAVMSNCLRPMDCSPPDSSVHGILQWILEWVATLASQWVPTAGEDYCHLHFTGQRLRDLPSGGRGLQEGSLDEGREIWEQWGLRRGSSWGWNGMCVRTLLGFSPRPWAQPCMSPSLGAPSRSCPHLQHEPHSCPTSQSQASSTPIWSLCARPATAVPSAPGIWWPWLAADFPLDRHLCQAEVKSAWQAGSEPS